MFKSFPSFPTTGKANRWGPLALIGLIAVLAGVLIPQLLPSPASAPPANPAPQNTGAVPAYTPPAWPEAPDSKAMLTRLATGTAVVLGLCVATLWFGKRWLTRPGGDTPGQAQFRLAETLPLGNRCCVHLVYVANRPLLVGADGSGLKVIVPLPDSFERALDEAQAGELPPPDAEPQAA